MKDKKEFAYWILFGIPLIISFGASFVMVERALASHSGVFVPLIMFAGWMAGSVVLWRTTKEVGVQQTTFIMWLGMCILTWSLVFFRNLQHFSDFMVPKITFAAGLACIVLSVFTKVRKKYDYSLIYSFLCWQFALASYGSLALGM